MQKYLTPSDKMEKARIADAMTRLGDRRKVQPGQTIKIGFFDSAPDYAIDSLDSFWDAYFPQVAKNYAPDDLQDENTWAGQINTQYKQAQKIQPSFLRIPPDQRQALFEQMVQFWQNTHANVRLEPCADPAQADVRIGLSGYDNINFAPGASPEPGRAKLGDVFLHATAADLPMDFMGERVLSNLLHEFGHVLGLSHPSVLEGDGTLPAEYGTQQYSIMSYGSVLAQFRPATPMLFDAVGLERMGLLKPGLGEGDSTYRFGDAQSGRLLIDVGGQRHHRRPRYHHRHEIDLRATDFAAGEAYFSSIGIGECTQKWLLIKQRP